MAVIRKVTRVSNPRRKYRRSKATRNSKGRFTRTRNSRGSGTKRKKNISLSTLTNEIKRLKSSLTGSTRRKRHHKRHARRKRNPVLIELGSMVNPKRRKNVAKTRKRRKSRNPRRHATAKVTYRRRRRTSHRRRRNPSGPPAWAPAKGYRRRRATNSRRRRVHHRRRRNPAVFGRSGGKDLLMMIGGGLVGVAATKYLPTLLPSSITAGLGGGPLMSVLITGAGAFAAAWIARKFVGGTFGDAVLFGGLMQAGSAALNAFVPPSIAGRLALSGVGDIVPGYYTVPQNPLKFAMASPGTGNGMGNIRRFGTFR